MAVMAASVAIVGVLSIVNLLLVLTVIRRSGRPTTTRTKQTQYRTSPRLPAGIAAPEFSGTTTSGTTVALSTLAGARSLIGFFSPGCEPCHLELPAFKDYARTMIPGGMPQVLAIVAGDNDATDEFIADLEGVAQVLHEAVRGPVATALNTAGYPTFYVLDETGNIEASGATMRMINSVTGVARG